MELQRAEHKIVKMLERQNAQNAIEEIKELFAKINYDDSWNSIQQEEYKEQIESELVSILEKYNLNQIAINVFSILEKTF